MDAHKKIRRVRELVVRSRGTITKAVDPRVRGLKTKASGIARRARRYVSGELISV
jgi:hypothetical protein